MNISCASSTERVNLKNMSENTIKRVLKKYKTLWILVIIVIILSLVNQNYTINQYVRAVFKFTIMHFIDLNNFKNLLYDSCLIYKKISKPELIESDCYTCENIDRVGFIHNNPEENLNSYTELYWPVTYKSYTTTKIDVKNIAFTLLNGEFLPCDYESNLKIDPLRAIEVKSGWFMHWRNCDDVLGKSMRSLYRPDSFLNISPETWTIMSFKYKTVHYKKINIDYNSRIAVSQISGTFYYQLLPKDLCLGICKPLDGRLKINHILVFDSFIWDFQYLPMNNSMENIAIVYNLN